VPCGSHVIKFARRNNLRVLFLTCRSFLLRQTADDIREYTGIVPGIVGDDEADYTQPVTLATIQSLYGHLKTRRAETASFLSTNHVLILDEAHTGSADSFQAVIPLCYRALYRIGVTATPFMKGDFESLRLISITGPTIKDIPMRELIDQGFLAQPLIKFVPIESPPLSKKLKWADAYANGIVNNAGRNERMIQEALDLASNGHQVLILIYQKKHGRMLIDILKTHYPHVTSRYDLQTKYRQNQKSNPLDHDFEKRDK
jgi:superfamily II DNA or RNA helicase